MILGQFTKKPGHQTSIQSCASRCNSVHQRGSVIAYLQAKLGNDTSLALNLNGNLTDDSLHKIHHWFAMAAIVYTYCSIINVCKAVKVYKANSLHQKHDPTMPSLFHALNTGQHSPSQTVSD